MKAHVQKWGNSLAIRIPAGVAREMAIVEGSAVDVQLDGTVLRVTPQQRIPTLDELLASVDPSNLHPEVDWGVPQGNEAW